MANNVSDLVGAGVLATETARAAGSMLSAALLDGSLGAMDYTAASELATAASLNPYAAFGEFGIDFPDGGVSRDATRTFFMDRYVTANEKAWRDAVVEATQAKEAEHESRALARCARAMDVDEAEARAAAILDDVSFIRKAEENLFYA